MRANHKLAQQLKEAGYDVPCDKYFTVQDGRITPRTSFSKMDYNNYNDKSKPYWTRPTLHEITDWLRGKGLHVSVSTYHYDANNYHWQSEIVVLDNGEYSQVGMFPDHDTALTAVIEAALVMLKERT